MPIEHRLPAAHNTRSPFLLVISIMGPAGVIAVFLPFAGNVTPLAAVGTLFANDSFLKGTWRMGAPSLSA